MKRFAFALAIVLALVLITGRWLSARGTERLQVVHSRISIPANDPLPNLPVNDPASVLLSRKLTASGEVLPGGRVKVTARCDTDAKPKAPPLVFRWKLEFLRDNQGDNQEPAWWWVYENPVNVAPGTHTTPEFTETVHMPAGEYLVRVWLLDSQWQEGIDGPQLIPRDEGAHTMKSFRVVVR